MRKIIILLFCLLLSACSGNSIELTTKPVTEVETVTTEPTETVDAEDNVVLEYETGTEISDKTTETEIYPIIIRSGNRQCGYVVGGLVNGEMIDFQENDNYKFFELTGNEKYMIFPNVGAPFAIQGKNIEKHYIEACGTHEFVVNLEDEVPMDADDFYVGIGNIVTPVEFGAEDFVDDNGSFCMDFDNDGHIERVIIDKTEGSEYISIILENKQGTTIIDKFYVDDTYTTEFGLLPIDIDSDGKKELVIRTEGHDYSTEIFKITSIGHQKIIGYYVSN